MLLYVFLPALDFYQTVRDTSHSKTVGSHAGPSVVHGLQSGIPSCRREWERALLMADRMSLVSDGMASAAHQLSLKADWMPSAAD